MLTILLIQMDMEKVVSGSYDNTLKIWDIKTGECSHTLRGHTDHVVCLQFSGVHLVSGSADRTIKVNFMEHFITFFNFVIFSNDVNNNFVSLIVHFLKYF